MRLINTRTHKLKDFGASPAPYAILSHTWGEDEVIFQDMTDLAAAKRKGGFSKIEGCCRQALKDGFDWAWIDTCCIDKSSSAELSETINSMYRWYEASLKCYAFLSDVASPVYSPALGDEPFESLEAEADFFASTWWTRGWTLQELIAPFDVHFYSKD